MNFTPQQLVGGTTYSHKTRVGNWYEDMETDENVMKNYLGGKEKGSLSFNITQDKYARSFKKVPQTFRADGTLEFGDKIMLANKFTKGFLSFDLGDKVATQEEAYACTSNPKVTEPVARSMFIIEREDEEDGFEGNKIHFGQKIRFRSNPIIIAKPLYLHSQQISPLGYSRFSRNQEVCMDVQKIYNTVWEVEHFDPNTRLEKMGLLVESNNPIIIKHCATCHYLASDLLEYRNDFGTEYEVNVHCYSAKNKSQNLELEAKGAISSGMPTKFVEEKNLWSICTSPDPKFDYEIEDDQKYTIQTLLKDLKAKLLQRGAYGIRGLGRIFRILDDNTNHQLDAFEFKNGLMDYGFALTDQQAEQVIKFFDKDNDGQVHFDEFLRYLKGDINEFRRGLIMQAYDKLDINGDGTVTLDDVAKLYDASQHPDVLSGKCTPEQVYQEFMSMWDTQEADGIVTRDEFIEYFRDVSASIDTDEYFKVMITNAWKL